MKSNCTGLLLTWKRWVATACAAASLATGALAQDSFRIGPFGVRSQVSSSVNWTDNISNASGGKEDGYWYTASTNHHASTTLAQRHSFFVATGFGVTHYPEHRRLNSVTPVSVSTGLNLDYGKYKFRIADNFSYQSRAADQTFAAGTARVDTYSNTFISEADVTLAPWNFSLDYVHSNTWYGTTNGQDVFNPQPNSRDLLNAEAEYTFKAWRGLDGVTGLGYSANWTDGELSESLRGKVGMRGPLTPNLDLDMVLTFAITGSSYYRATLKFHNSITKKINYSITAGILVSESAVSSKKRVSLVLSTNISFADKMEFPQRVSHTIDISVTPFDVSSTEQAQSATNYSQPTAGSYSETIAAAYRMRYRITERVSLNPFVSWTRIRTRGAGTNETVEFLSAGISTGYQVTKKFSVGASYSYNNRKSNLGSAREYESNTLSFSGTYVF